MDSKMNIEWNGKGQTATIEITAAYDELAVFKFPDNCGCCPTGFSCSGHCGRNVPFKPEDYKKRPDTCKLKLIDIAKCIEAIASKQSV